MDNSVDAKKLNIDLADYWMIIRKRFVSVLLIFVLVVLVTYSYTKTVKPEYESSAKIKLALRQPMATIQGAQITWYGSRGNEIPSEIKLIKNKTGILSSVPRSFLPWQQWEWYLPSNRPRCASGIQFLLRHRGPPW